MKWTWTLGLSVCLLSGCQWRPPQQTDMSGFGLDERTRLILLSKGEATADDHPRVTLPARIAVVGVRGVTCHQDIGRTDYALAEDWPTQREFDAIAGMPRVSGAITLDRRVLGAGRYTGEELVEAAHRAGATLVLICGASGHTADKDHVPPLTLFTLGLSPTQTARAEVVAEGVLLDAATGHVLGAARTEGEAVKLANAWTDDSARDDAMKRAERRALDRLIDGFEPSWLKLTGE